MGYSDNQFTFNSTGTGVMAAVITSSSFYCGKLRENLTILPFIILITDSNEDVLCKYTLEPVNVDSSSLLTFGAIDEAYARKTDIEDITIDGVDLSSKANVDHAHTMSDIVDLTFPETDLSSKADADHTHNISEITDLQDTLNSKVDKEHTHEISEVKDLQDFLNSKAEKEHTHNISDIIGLSLDGVDLFGIASKDHTHDITDTTFTWNETNMPTNTRWWSSLCYGNGKFMAIASRTITGAYSEDGEKWTNMSMPSSDEWLCVCYGNGKFVDVAYSTAVYSEDVEKWTEMSLPIKREWRSVCYGNRKFIIINEESDI